MEDRGKEKGEMGGAIVAPWLEGQVAACFDPPNEGAGDVGTPCTSCRACSGFRYNRNHKPLHHLNPADAKQEPRSH